MQLLQCIATPLGDSGRWNSCNARAHELGGRGVLPRRWSLPKKKGAPACTATLLGRSGHWNSCHDLPSRQGAVGGATPAIDCLTVWGPWAVEQLQRTASLGGRSGHWNSGNALPHRKPVGSGTLAMRGPTDWGDGESCRGGARCRKRGTLAMHCNTASRQWAVELMSCAASLPGGSGQCNSCNALPHCLGAVGSESPAMHCLTDWGQWAVELFQRIACCLGTVGSGIPAMHCLTTLGLSAVELLQCTASPPRGRGHWNSCNTLPFCLGTVGSANLAMHCHTAWGQWEVELLQCASPAARRTGSPAQGMVAALRAQLLQCTATLPGVSGRCNSCDALLRCPGALECATFAIHCRTA